MLVTRKSELTKDFVINVGFIGTTLLGDLVSETVLVSTGVGEIMEDKS